MIGTKISKLALAVSLLVGSASCTYAMDPEEDWKSRSVFTGSDQELFKLIETQEAETKKIDRAVGLHTASLTTEEVWAIIQAQNSDVNNVRNGYRIFQPKEEQKARPKEARPTDLGLGDFLLKLEENPTQMAAVWTKWIANREERRTPIIVAKAQKAEENAGKRAQEAEAAKKAAQLPGAGEAQKVAAQKKQAEAAAARKAADAAKKTAEVAKKTLEVTQEAAKKAPAIKRLGPVAPVTKKQVSPVKGPQKPTAATRAKAKLPTARGAKGRANLTARTGRNRLATLRAGKKGLATLRAGRKPAVRINRNTPQRKRK